MNVDRSLRILRERNQSLIQKLKQNQERCQSMVQRTKENSEEPSASRKRPNHDVTGDDSSKRPRRPSAETKLLKTSADARQKLHSRSYSGDSTKKKKKRTYTSTPVSSPRKDDSRRLGPKTPQSILKKRKLIDRNVPVESKLSDRSLCNTPDPSRSDWLNFSYDASTVRSPHSYNTRLASADNSRNAIIDDSRVDDDDGAADGREQPRAAAADTAADSRRKSLLKDGGNSRSSVIYQKDKTNRSAYMSPPYHPLRCFDGFVMMTSHDRYAPVSVVQVAAPMLGYDWIAGALDNTRPSAVDKSDAYFDAILTFRKQNKEMCVSKTASDNDSAGTSADGTTGADDSTLVLNPEHTCIHTYVVNDRLFAQPLNRTGDGQSACPVCSKPKKDPTSVSPAYVRVSLPRKKVGDKYVVKPHRRRSFDPSDSCALSEHCLAGMQSSRPSSMRPAGSVDMRSAVVKGAKSKFVLDSDVDKIIREEKQHYQTPVSLTRSRVENADLQRAHAAKFYRPDDMTSPGRAMAVTSRGHVTVAGARRSQRTDALLDTSYALRRHAQHLERKAHAQPAGNSTRYPVGV